MIGYSRKIAPLLLHPNYWIRYSTISFLVSVSKKISTVDKHVLLIPTIKYFLIKDIADIDADTLLECVGEPVSKHAFSQAISLHYTQNRYPRREKIFSAEISSGGINVYNQKNNMLVKTLPAVPEDIKNEEFESMEDVNFSLQLAELENLTPSEEAKLYKMKEYIKQVVTTYYKQWNLMCRNVLLESVFYQDEDLNNINISTVDHETYSPQDTEEDALPV